MPTPTYNDPTQGALAPIQTNAVNQQTYAPVDYGLSSNVQGLIDQNINPITGKAIKTGFLQKGGGAELALGGIQTLGSLWNSFQQQKLAKKTFKFNQEVYRTNLKNQTSTYNTALEDRIRARYATEGRSDQADSYIDKNKL